MSGTDDSADVAIVGAGIVGLATALTLARERPALRILVLDKEPAPGRHQTGHNSGVIHSGVYYRPGSAKARLCLRGRGLLLEYCRERGVASRQTGKLVVAASPAELPALSTIRERALANGVAGVRLLSAAEIRDAEPEVRGVAALDVPSTAIVDYGEVVRALADDVQKRGGVVRLSAPITTVAPDSTGVRLGGTGGMFRVRFLVNCAGLESDRVARLAGVAPGVRIVPFRGEFYEVRESRRLAIHRLIYPVPDPDLPFLGVHLTLTMRGPITAGPNAVLAGGREAYSRFGVSPGDLAEMAMFPGFWRMARQYWRVAAYEQLRSLDRSLYASDVQRLVPGLSADDLVRGGSGVRAQAVDAAGRLVDDFVFESGTRSLHVLNAPSPAATSSFAIAEEIVRRVPDLA